MIGQQFGDWLATNWFTLVTTIIGIIATIVVGYLAYVLAKRDKCPHYSVKSNNIIRNASDKIEGLELNYRGHGTPIENATVSHVLFWNGGKDTISSSDVVKDEPVRIQTKDNAVILSVKVLENTQPANRVRVQRKQDKQSAVITFDYLDHNDGAVIQIIHTGLSSEDVKVLGLIKGAGSPKLIPSIQERIHKRRITGVALVLLGFVVSIPLVRIEEQLGIRKLVTALLCDGLLILLILTILWGLFKKWFKPTLFDKFNSEL